MLFLEDLYHQRRESVNKDFVVLGLDANWERDHNGRSRKVATLQLATRQRGNVFHISSIYRKLSRRRPLNVSIPGICRLLGSGDVLLTGKQVGGDVSRLHAYWGFPKARYVELGALCKRQALINHAGISLSELVTTVLCMNLPKPSETRNSSWETMDLCEEQRTYASNDVYASLQVFIKALSPECGIPSAPSPGKRVCIVNGSDNIVAEGYFPEKQPEKRGRFKVKASGSRPKRAVLHVDRVLEPNARF